MFSHKYSQLEDILVTDVLIESTYASQIQAAQFEQQIQLREALVETIVYP